MEEPDINETRNAATPLLKRRLVKSILEVIGVAGFILFIGYASLISSSDPISSEQQLLIDRAVELLDKKGFATEAFFLDNLVRFRSTDNWWNRKFGHETAYAATNFPFEIITLYPPFFEEPVDDVERASILLHEAYHLFGYGEEGASMRVWQNKAQLGWTKQQYRTSRVWTSTIKYTNQFAPYLFQCGPSRNADCAEDGSESR